LACRFKQKNTALRVFYHSYALPPISMFDAYHFSLDFMSDF